jgi:hypothetical protein
MKSLQQPPKHSLHEFLALESDPFLMVGMRHAIAHGDDFPTVLRLEDTKGIGIRPVIEAERRAALNPPRAVI